MFDVAAHPPTLLAVVNAGPMAWRNSFAAQFGVLIGPKASGEVVARIADAVFRFYCRQVIDQFGDPHDIETMAARHGLTTSVERLAGETLDHLEEVKPPSDQDINDGWEIESGSSDAGRRFFYGPDGSPQAFLDKLKAGADPTDLVH